MIVKQWETLSAELWTHRVTFIAAHVSWTCDYNAHVHGFCLGGSS